MIFSFSKESILFLYNIFSHLLSEYIDLRKPSSFLFLKTKQNKNHKQMDILFLPSVLWYIFYPFIIGDSICAQPHASHDDGIYQKEFLNEDTESNTLSHLYDFYYGSAMFSCCFAGNSRLVFLVDGKDLPPDI